MEELWGRLAEDKAVAAVNQPLPSQAVKNFGVCRVGHGSSPIVNVSVNLWLGCSRMTMAMSFMVFLTMMMLMVLVLATVTGV